MNFGLLLTSLAPAGSKNKRTTHFSSKIRPDWLHGRKEDGTRKITPARFLVGGGSGTAHHKPPTGLGGLSVSKSVLRAPWTYLRCCVRGHEPITHPPSREDEDEMAPLPPTDNLPHLFSITSSFFQSYNQYNTSCRNQREPKKVRSSRAIPSTKTESHQLSCFAPSNTSSELRRTITVKVRCPAVSKHAERNPRSTLSHHCESRP